MSLDQTLTLLSAIQTVEFVKTAVFLLFLSFLFWLKLAMPVILNAKDPKKGINCCQSWLAFAKTFLSIARPRGVHVVQWRVLAKVETSRYTRFQRYFGVEGDLDVDVGVRLPGYDLMVEDSSWVFCCAPFLTVEKLWPSGLVVQMPIMAIKKQKSQEKINQVDLVIQHFSSSENEYRCNFGELFSNRMLLN